MFTLVSLILGGFFWNAWVFGWINHGMAGYLHMSISELNVAGQPGASWFVFAEVASGLFLFIAGLAIALNVSRQTLLTVIAICITIIGLLTIYDGVRPLDCSRYDNVACQRAVHDGSISQSDTDHNIESRITYYLSILFSLLVSIWLYRFDRHHYTALIGLLTLLGVVTTLIILSLASSEIIVSLTERSWNVLISFDFLLIGYSLVRQKSLRSILSEKV